MSMEYFCCYHSYKKKCEKLSDQELGRLFRALLEYSESGAVADLAGRESIAFDFIADDINRAKKAYAEKCAKNAANAQQRTLANANGRIRTLANANGRSQNKEENEEENEKENEEENKEINPPYSPPKVDGNDLFEQFWAVYPHKVGKGAARKAWKKIKPSKALCQKMIDAVKLAKKSQEWAEDGGAYIPHPSTWLNQERWEDTLTPLGQQIMPRKQGDDYSSVFSGQKAKQQENPDEVFADYPDLKARYAGYCQECAQNGQEPMPALEFLALQKPSRKAGGEYAEVY